MQMVATLYLQTHRQQLPVHVISEFFSLSGCRSAACILLQEHVDWMALLLGLHTEHMLSEHDSSKLGRHVLPLIWCVGLLQHKTPPTASPKLDSACNQAIGWTACPWLT